MTSFWWTYKKYSSFKKCFTRKPLFHFRPINHFTFSIHDKSLISVSSLKKLIEKIYAFQKLNCCEYGAKITQIKSSCWNLPPWLSIKLKKSTVQWFLNVHLSKNDFWFCRIKINWYGAVIWEYMLFYFLEFSEKM